MFCVIINWCVLFGIVKFGVGEILSEGDAVNKNDVTSQCYACKNRTVLDAIVFRRFVHHFKGKQQIGFLNFTFCLVLCFYLDSSMAYVST